MNIDLRIGKYFVEIGVAEYQTDGMLSQNREVPLNKKVTVADQPQWE